MNLLGYRLLIFMALPLFAYAAFKRCQKAKAQKNIPNIKQCFGSRFGLNNTLFEKGGIWIHAVSVGETRSTFPLISALKQQYPNLPITLTSGSIQGAIQALQFSPEPIQHQMIPYDYPFAIKRFLNKIQPRLVIMIETEIWPNLYQACHSQDIPLVLANARLKDKSFQAYQKYASKLVVNALNQTKFIAAQFQKDADNFHSLGVASDHIQVIGNIKSAIEIAPDLAKEAQNFIDKQGLNNRFIWVAASTHGAMKAYEAEEVLLLKVHQKLLEKIPNALLILAPRHPERFAEVADFIPADKLAIRSKKQPITEHTQVYLADTVGEMMTWLKVSQVAFIGGSLVPFGGHNILEPTALGKPTLSGPHVQNLQALFNEFIKEEAVLIVEDEVQLAEELYRLATDHDFKDRMHQNATACFQKQGGALDKLMPLLAPYLEK